MTEFHQQLESAKSLFRKFVYSMHAGNGEFRLTSESEVSPFARCFAIFAMRLLLDDEFVSGRQRLLLDSMVDDLEKFRRQRLSTKVDLAMDKPYLQLLTFTLSAFSIVCIDEVKRLNPYVEPFVDCDVDAFLRRSGALAGKPQSGNLAMFVAILLLHADRFMGREKSKQIGDWVRLHMHSMNAHGFWGDSRTMSHLQFQNGYHQYEILDCLKVQSPIWKVAANHVASLADDDGHFAPYPGGGGCYDYDAVFIITGAGSDSVSEHEKLLRKTASTILSEQNADGGFCESRFVRPRSLAHASKMVRHVLRGRGAARVERLRYCLSLQRPLHDRIRTHWSQYSRRWDESDLWDSWFRMLALAKIDVAINGSSALPWGLIRYPGIGYCHSGN